MWGERYSLPPAARCGQRGRACAKYTLIRQKTGKSGDGRRSHLAQGIKRYTRKALPEKLTMSPCNDNDKSVMFMSGAGGCCRSEEHTSELQSLMRNSYAVLCLKK